MHPRARRAISVALSVALHALVLLDVYTWTLARPGFPEQKPLPVRIIEPKPAARAPKPPAAAKPPAPAPAPAPAPPPVAQAPEPPPVAEPPKPAPPPQPEKKIPLPEQQIVSPPDAGKNEPPPPETRLLSDLDNKVDQQMVKRGEPKPGDESPGKTEEFKPAQMPKAGKPQRGRGGERQPPPQVAALPGLDRLMPNALRLAEEGYGNPELAQAQEAVDAQQPRRDPRHADGLWIPSDGPTGTLDALPDVREGDITMLNTKAEVFAPFVRRVAIRVFQNFWISLKRDLGASTLPAIETIEAEAVMSPRGEMVGFTINRRSTRISMASDRRLQQACNDGFFDRNPPPGARAPDGNIHFVLRTNVEVGPSPRGWAGYVEFMAGLL